MSDNVHTRISPAAVAGKHLILVTGKLAAEAVEAIASATAKRFGFTYRLAVMPITVAALISGKWLLRHLAPPIAADYVVVPGYLDADALEIAIALGCDVVVGPRDIRQFERLFGEAVDDAYSGEYDIEIIAEINFASRLDQQRLLKTATLLADDGADVIDLGCEPNRRWQNVAAAVQLLREKNLRCSIDTFDIWEAQAATDAGAELVLSVNASNREAAADWDAEVVVVPDPDRPWQQSFDESIAYLERHNRRYRLDPILDPIGCGFADSLVRYEQVRQRYPDAAMMMGIGNLTELTDVDSAGINMLLLACCQQWAIRSVLTTQVINWARTSVRECDIARRMTYWSQRERLPPKRLDERLVMLRDPRLSQHTPDYLATLAQQIRDNNYRIHVADGEIHLLSAQTHLRGRDPFAIMQQLMTLPISRNVDASHAFYLGFELHKAMTALMLGKQYEQDVSLRWGWLQPPVDTHQRLPRRHSDRSDLNRNLKNPTNSD